MSRFTVPDECLIGFGATAELVPMLKEMGKKRCLIVTEQMLMSLGITKKPIEALERAGLEWVVFDGVCANPTIGAVQAGLEVQKREQCDMVMSIGGGSSLDCGKAIAILSTNDVDIHTLVGADLSKNPGLPIVAVNTTAGTGSETTRSYVITDEAAKQKLIMKDRHALSTIAVVDPSLMMGLPASVTAATGMDALTHAVESYVSTRANSFTRCFSREAIGLIARNLERAVCNGSDREAREQMAAAEYLAGMSFGNTGLGIAHGMSHQLGGIYNLAHGLCNAIMLPLSIDFNMPVCEALYAELAPAFGIDGGAAAVRDEILRISTNVGTNQKLSSLGVQEESLPLLSERALHDFATVTNPRVPTYEEIEQLYRSCM